MRANPIGACHCPVSGPRTSISEISEWRFLDSGAGRFERELGTGKLLNKSPPLYLLNDVNQFFRAKKVNKGSARICTSSVRFLRSQR